MGRDGAVERHGGHEQGLGPVREERLRLRGIRLCGVEHGYHAGPERNGPGRRGHRHELPRGGDRERYRHTVPHRRHGDDGLDDGADGHAVGCLSLDRDDQGRRYGGGRYSLGRRPQARHELRNLWRRRDRHGYARHCDDGTPVGARRLDQLYRHRVRQRHHHHPACLGHQ